MQIESKSTSVNGLKFFVSEDGKEIARVYLYFLRNDLHAAPFGFLEDLFVDEAYRRQGLATALIKKAVSHAKEQGCYKLIGTSRLGRELVHQLYETAGFQKHGFEFRMDL